jgi:hypothetical protein
MPRSLAVAVLTALLVAPGAAAAAKHKPRSVYASPLLWATVNTCDTPDNPDTIGIRGSIPGSGVRGESMYLRFQVQYFSRSENRWHNIAQGADSDWVSVGSALYKVREAGWSFRFSPPADGSSYILRGAVTFEWRKGTKVVRRARKRTRSGHASAAGSDPAGYSAAKCEIK